MNLSELQKKLIEVARQHEPGDHVPYAFEKRVMAHLAVRPLDHWTVWGCALWRAAISCVLAMLVLGAWSSTPVKADEPELSQQFEETIFASVNHQIEDAW